jgi:hypothetical protein
MSTDTRSRGRQDASESDGAGDRRSLKVKIPADYHTKLHSIKVLTGKTISSAITEALRDYLDEVEVESSEGAEPA